MKLKCKLCEKKTEHKILKECICNEDCGGGYTFRDEFGPCDFCLGTSAICEECNSSRKINDE